MRLKFFCPRWGSETLGWDAFLQKAKEAGYDGVEWGISNDALGDSLAKVWEKLEKYELEIIPQHYGTYEADFPKHYDQFGAWFEKIRPFPALKVNSQTGKDFFTFDQNKALIELAGSFAQSTGVPVYHETHRNKFSFAAHIAKEYLSRMPSLKLTLDISHWVNVAESYLEDQQEAVQLAISRTEHLHARIGHPQGPQISDPRAPEWQEAVHKHLAWWDGVVEHTKRKGRDAVLTITPEFGPHPYMFSLPFTQRPIANQWDINLHMFHLLKRRYLE